MVTVMHCVVAPVLHRYEDIPADAAHNCVEPPMQKSLPVILHTGKGYVVIVLLQLLVQPYALVTVTE